VGFHLTPEEMALSSITQQQILVRMWGKETLLQMVDCKLVQLLWKATWRSLKKLKIDLPYNLVIPSLGT
jgi:hypothetical protein